MDDCALKNFDTLSSQNSVVLFTFHVYILVSGNMCKHFVGFKGHAPGSKCGYAKDNDLLLGGIASQLLILPPPSDLHSSSGFVVKQLQTSKRRSVPRETA